MSIKRIILYLLLTISFSCNMSDREYELPSQYIFIKEGGNCNSITRNHKLIINGGVVNFNYNDEFIFFSVDTTYSMEPNKIAKEKLMFYVHNIKKNTFSKPLNYNFVKNFILKNNISDENNILLKN